MNELIYLCSSFLNCLRDFQTLIAGILALISALYAGRAVLRAAREPIDAEAKRFENEIERRRQFTCALLSAEFMRVSELARQAESTIKVVVASNANVTENIRAKTTIPEPPLLDDWESMSLLTKVTLDTVMNTRAKLRRHNFDIARAGGAFGDINFQKHVQRQAAGLRSLAQDAATKLNNEKNRGSE